ncbi:MAG: hypothetical protein QM479_09005 [Pseudomonadota bacterium]
MRLIIRVVLIVGFIFSSACQHLISRDEVKKAYLINSRFEMLHFDSLEFNIEAWAKINVKADDFHKKNLVIYIEGDGRAWRTRFKLSKDPSPDDPLALKLATLDQAENILYLARPCQYRSIKDKSCQTDKKYWSSHRYNNNVVETYNKILNQLKTKYNFKGFDLVAYSGGGVIAALLAATRSDISTLITISSNLDHQSWTKYHNISELWGSLNLYSQIVPLSKVKQIHLWGSEDKIVPNEINSAILRQLTRLNPNIIHKQIVENYDHHCCWKNNWAERLTQIRLVFKKSGESYVY